MADLATALLPVLHRPLAARFNVFDVMRHGTDEKQISNVFRWLLETGGTHQLGDTFLRIFLAEVDRDRVGQEPLPVTEYLLLQEQNTAAEGQPRDIADLVLLAKGEAAIVVENYVTSDGHGHSYTDYEAYGRRRGPRSVVVLLCQERDSALQTDGWQNAAVVTYAQLLERLRRELAADRDYQRNYPEPFSFIDQMHRKYVKGRDPVEQRQVLDFVVAMCATGEARRYAEQPQSSAAARFGNDVAEQALERFGEGRDLLATVKRRLASYCKAALVPQLDATLGEGFVQRVEVNYAGVFQWTVGLVVRVEEPAVGPETLQLKFGPSAWYANTKDAHWTNKPDPGAADYTRLFLTRVEARQIHPSAVTLQMVLDGLSPTDRTLHDEFVALLRGSD